MDPGRTIQTLIDQAEESRLRTLLGDLGRQAAACRFHVAPNPCVGAAVLSDGVEIGRGFHRLWGGPHAEVLALEAAAQSGVPRDRWDTLVCTLEPCSTQGKTPPCTEALIAAGIRRVVVSEFDPDARHRGKSLEHLLAAGLDVVHLKGAAPLRDVTPHFERWTSKERLRRPRPWTIAKWAQTRTGQLIPPKNIGEGRWISGPEALAEVQHLRAHSDAILTGVGTVLADDPRLTLRLPEEAAATAPLRVVLDSGLHTPVTARLFAPPSEGERGGRVHVFTRAGAKGAQHRALQEAGAEIHAVRPGDDGRPSLREVLHELYTMGARRVLLEAGPTLVDAFFASEFVDQVQVYTGDVNGGEGPSLGEWLRPRRLAQVERGEIGTDGRLRAFVTYS